jgi:hypothetical protein
MRVWTFVGCLVVSLVTSACSAAAMSPTTSLRSQPSKVVVKTGCEEGLDEFWAVSAPGMESVSASAGLIALPTTSTSLLPDP